MKVALVHELLTMKGGAERFLRILAEMFPDAPIFTLLYDEKKMGDWFPRERIRASRLQKFSLLTKNHHLYLPFFPGSVEAWDFSDFDLVISSSSAFAHGIKTGGKTKHLSYIHSPARYLWDRTHDVLERASESALGGLKKKYLSMVFHRLRAWDASAAERPGTYLAASKAVERRIELYWNKRSTVLHPPIEEHWFNSDAQNRSRDSFLIVSTLAPYKRIDIAIDACSNLGLPLTIIGEGPARADLQRRAGKTITFLGYKNHSELRSFYQNARALIVPGEEDFCLTALEAMASGSPVIAYAKGGTLETIDDGATGLFFREPTAESLASLLESFDASRFDPETCARHAMKWRRTEFEKKFGEIVHSLR